nr:MFS transporter [Trinickia mobilis]
MILYLGWWFSQRYRVRAVSAFFLAMPVSSVVGGPMSGLILGLDGYLGLAGWKWLFILESLPALVLGVVVLATLPRDPAAATFISESERRWLLQALAAESRPLHERSGVAGAVLDPAVWLLGAMSFGVNFARYAFGMWLPLVVKDFGISDSTVGWLSALPYTLGATAMLLASRVAQIKTRQLWLLCAGCAIASISLFAVRWATTPSATLVVLCVCAVDIFVFLGTFWGTAPGVLSGSTRPVGIALINSIGRLSGYCGPYALGYLKDASGSFNISLALMGFGPLFAALALLLLSGRLLSRASWPPRAVPA